MSFDRIAVLGAGAWGCALANVAARAGRSVTLWARHREAAEAMSATRRYPRLPGSEIEPGVACVADLSRAADADALLLAVPAQALRGVATAVAPIVRTGVPMIACAKGIERGTHRFMTEVVAEPSGSITRAMCAASRSAAPPRMCWRSPPASSTAANSAPAPPPL
jgi:glycerol-3-phosphate dehydrogenase (NAD(P)+)